MTFAMLAREKADRYRSMGAFGKPAYQNHMQLKAMLRAKRGQKFSDYLSRPTYDPDAGELRWTADVPGTARRYAELTREEQAHQAQELASIRSGLLGFVQELRAQGGDKPGGASAYATVLEQAMRVPAQGDFLYFVGKQPVIAFWGFQDEHGRSVDPSEIAPPVPQSEPVVVDTPPPADIKPVAPPMEPVQPVLDKLAPVVAVDRKRRWWLWALLALLAALALAWALRGCFETPAGPKLDIPRGALERGDLSFLEGDWQLGEARINVYEGKPNNIVGSERIVLRFGKTGSGTNRAIERLRHGRSVTDCSGVLSSRTDGTKLYFQLGMCRTPDRSVADLGGSRHECERNAAGTTMCYGVNPDGFRWEAPLRRLQ